MKQIINLWLGIVLLSATMSANGQGAKDALFDETNAAIAYANEAQLERLSPQNYAKAMNHYQDAARDFQRGGSLDGIRGDLDATRRYLEEAKKVAEVIRVSLTTMLSARSDAVEANAHDHAPELWRDAASDFEDAVEWVERGDMNRAKSEALKAETEFRQAELTAIKRYYLSTARQTLERADDERADRYASKTFSRAERLIAEAEQALTDNRYDTDVARGLAKEAEYEAKHAIYVSELVQEVRKNDESIEELILQAEQPLKRISDSVDFLARFATGHGPATDEIIARVEQALNALQTTKEELTESQRQVAQLEYQLGDVSEARQALAKRQQTFERVSGLFTQAEARVIRDDNNIIVRLISLNFPSGKATIEPRNFALLAKVQDALSAFSDSDVHVEGHTDSYGGDQMNLELSEQRATAVRQYLLSNMDAPPSIEAIGFGETQPVGNNESEAGRAKNRRIDIVIAPNWDTVQLASMQNQ